MTRSPGALARRAARVAVKTLAAASDLVGGRLPGPRFLIYHQVEAGLGREMEVSRAVFLSQLEWLGQHGSIVDLDTAWRRRTEPGADRLFVLTFDDGYADMYQHAYPALAAERIPFTLYLTTHPVESGEPLAVGANPLDWDQVRTMASSGLMTLGAHTHRHLDLRRLDRHGAAAEIELSNELIVRRVGITPRHFAYPWGFFAPTADPVVRSTYQTAAAGSEPVDADADPHRLGRQPVQASDGLLFFRRRMWGGLRLETRLRRRLREGSGPAEGPATVAGPQGG